MKNVRVAKQRQYHSPTKHQTTSREIAIRANSPRGRAILMGLMVPMLMMVMTASMFGIALPTLRNVFDIPADITAWLITAYTLPFIIFMPLYGRLGDMLGKVRLLLLGVAIFVGGSVLTLIATNLGLLFLGRIIQGVGSAGINPLSLAIISDLFPAGERGKALGSWNSVGPLGAIGAPFMAGFMIDHLSWRAIFVPVLLAGGIALVAVQRQTHTIPEKPQSISLRAFDWIGVILLSFGTIFLVFYVSSRPITGVAALLDWRLLSLAVLFFVAFVWWERRLEAPFINLAIFTNKSFNRASICAGIRMFTLSSTATLLLPLYLADVHQLSAASTGMVIMLHALALLITMRNGGQLADRWTSRWPIVIGASGQLGAMVGFALLPPTAPMVLVIACLVLNGLSAGLALPAMHRASMSRISHEHMGGAAGLYSMIRFSGTVLGTALAGVLLQQGLAQFMSPVTAYQMVFWFLAAVALLGVVIGWGLRE